MKFLQSKKHELGFALHTRIIVQQQNYTQMESFYNLCQTFDVDTVEYSRVTNWGTWNFLEFNSHDVLNPVHPEYALAQAELARVKQLSGTWFAGM